MRVDKAPLVLARAVAQAGSVAALAADLRISERLLRSYLNGNESIPDSLFLEAVEIMLNGPCAS